MRLTFAAVVAALALAGCGGNDTGGASASGVVPADAVAYVEIQTDLGSGQWGDVQRLLDRFPSQPKLVELLNDALRSKSFDYERDVRPALGDTLAIAVRGPQNDEAFTLLTQSPDRDKLRALLDKLSDGEPYLSDSEPYAIDEVDGWTAVALNQTVIDQLREAVGSLAADDTFATARDALPDDVLGWGFARGSAIDAVSTGFVGPSAAQTAGLDWVAIGAEAHDDGAALRFVTSGKSVADAKTYSSERVDQAPADALAFVSLGTDPLRAQASALRSYGDLLGLPLDELLADLRGEAALWVRPGAGLPEVTLVVDSANPQRLVDTLRRLLDKVPLELSFGVVGGQAVATTAGSPQAALASKGEGLASTDDFKQAAEAAGMPDETAGFLYVNVADAVPLLGLAVAAGVDVPKDVLDNLRPVRSVVGWVEVEGGVATSRLFVHIQ